MSEQLKHSRPQVGMISLGCAKNLVDAEIMLGALLRDGVRIINDPAKADVVIVNTCSFIDSAQEESVDAILESAEVREANQRGQALVVAGCLSQRFRNELPALLPEVDAFMGIDQVARVTEIIQEAIARRATKLNQKSHAGSRTVTGKKAIAKGLADLDRRSSGNREPDTSQSLRGTERFGKTRTIISVPPALPSRSDPILEVNARPTYIPDYATPRFRLTPKHFAYLKIAEGCNHPCSFCIIPSMRGSHRSRTQKDVAAEARELLKDGVRELNLISQDSTYYGLDLRANHSRAIASPDRFNAAVQDLPSDATTISTLIRELNGLRGDFWVRLLYTHPAHWTDELIATIAESSKVARYIDIPLQHIHDNMLERMRRETSRQHIVDLLRRIRAGIPGIAIRTTFIVGFPGETEEYFESLLDFMRETRFERLGIFTYSREEGTRAGAMAGQVPDRVKQRRREQAMALQRELSREHNQAMIGRRLKVLVESEAKPRQLDQANVSSWEHGLIRQEGAGGPGLKGKWFVARGEADAPDIDGRVYVRGHVVAGEFATVKVTGCSDYDLFAEVNR